MLSTDAAPGARRTRVPRLLALAAGVLMGCGGGSSSVDGTGGAPASSSGSGGHLAPPTGTGGAVTPTPGTSGGSGGSTTTAASSGRALAAPVSTGGSDAASGGLAGGSASGGSGDPGGGGGTGGRSSGPGSGGVPAGGPGGRASGTAGTSAGGAPGAGGQTAVAGALCPAAALFCEDFESGNLNAWTKMESGGTLAIDSTHASNGKSALGITMATGQRGGWIERNGAPLFPLPANAFYGRLMVYFESLPTGHTDIVRGAATGAQTPWYNVGEQFGKVLLNYYGNGSDCWARPSPSTDIPLKTWMCWEWSYDGTKNQMQFFINSQLARSVDGVGDGCTGPNVWKAPQFNNLSIGAYNAQPTNEPSVGKMWLDDIAVSTTGRLGCPAVAGQ